MEMGWYLVPEIAGYNIIPVYRIGLKILYEERVSILQIIYIQIFTAFWLFLNLKEYDIYLSYHIYSYIIYITMHFLNKFSHDNDLILVHRKLGQKLITMEDFIILHNMWTLFNNILFGKMNRM